MLIRSEYWRDQTLLARHVWPWAHLQALQHDSYNCMRCSDFDINIEIEALYTLLRFPGSMGFPTARRNTTNNFVGAVASMNWTLWEKCPVECRREGHEDWERC